MKFITVKNNVITGVHMGTSNPDLFNTVYYGHEIIEIPVDAEVFQGDTIECYNNWKRKSNVQLIEEGLIKLPPGYVIENAGIRKLTDEEQVIQGLIPPAPGYKVSGGEVIPMTGKEMHNEGLLSDEEYVASEEANALDELNNRLSVYNSNESKARAEIDAEFALERKKEITTLLSVKDQPGWPLEVIWP